MQVIDKLKSLHANNAKWAPVSFFAAGFCLDILMLRRIDDPICLAKQILYLTLATVILCLSLVGFTPKTERFRSIWEYREDILSFILGSLLSLYTIFYFKAASVFTSALFLLILCGILYLNESKRARKASEQVQVGLYSLCLASFFTCLIPILMGHVGALPFLLSMAGSTSIALFPYRYLVHRQAQGRSLLVFSTVHLLFIILYFTSLIPPVPLAVNAMGIYHDVKKVDGKFQLSSMRPDWKFWKNGDQDFQARNGDKIFFYARIFSPGDFAAKLNIHWLHFENNKWETWDDIPLPVSGGREEGFRAHAVKSNYAPGEWRVQVETEDGRELGRLYFTVVADESLSERNYQIQYE